MEAYVTLVATESYASGALVIARRLRELGSTKDLICLTTPNISSRVCDKLGEVFTLIQVDELRSNDHANLELLGRPDLDITFTKIHLWKLTQYRKVVFLDADTLPLRNIDELFDRPAFSAAPDAGWPDCFNSGVFVAEPSESTFESLVELSNEKGSFDGGDQGLLNTFFSTWSNSPANRLPFTYNTTPTAQYGYAPALNEFGHSISVLHFIGQNKPWTYQRFSDGRVFTRGDASSGTKDMLQIWWDTWDKYYGRTSPYHLLSGNFDEPGFDSGFQTQPILQFDETIQNAWEKQEYNPDDERRQVNPMPPLSSITISQPAWIEEKRIEQELHHEQSNTQQDNHDQQQQQQERHLVEHAKENHETNHQDHPHYQENREEHHHDHDQQQQHQEEHASHKQPKTYSMIEWDPAYQDPPNTGSLAANIPDLSYYKNVWDQPELEKVNVWVAPLHHPEPEVMARPEYSHYDTKEYEDSQKQFHKIYHHDKEADHHDHQDHQDHQNHHKHHFQQEQQRQEHQHNEWDQHEHQHDHHNDRGHEVYNTWYENNDHQNRHEHTHREEDHSQVHQLQEHHQHDQHDNYHQATDYQEHYPQEDYKQEHYQQAQSFHENNQNQDYQHHEQYQAEHHHIEPQNHGDHEKHEYNEHFHQEYNHHHYQQEQHHHSEHHEQEQHHHSENHEQEHRQVVYPPVFPWESKSNHFPPPTRIWIDEQISEAPFPFEEEKKEEEEKVPEPTIHKEEEHIHQEVYFPPVFPWETVTDHFPPPTRIWQDEQPQNAKQVEITNNERPAVVEQNRVIKKESSQRFEKETFELQNITSEEDYQVDILLDQPLTDEPLEEPVHFGFAIDTASNSPSFQNKIFEFMETLEDLDEDMSVRDLIPINFKPSSRLNSGIYTPSSATSSRTHSRSNSRSSSRRASVVSSRRSSVSNVNQTRKPIMAVPPSLNITQNVQPTSKLFAAESSFYSRKTPYTSAAVTPAAGRTPEIEKRSYFDADEVYDEDDINLAQVSTVKHDFLNTSSYSLNKSIEKRKNMTVTADEWDPLKALRKLKAQSESMVLRKSLEEVLNSEAATATDVVESPELAEEHIIVENKVPLFESIWNSSGPSSSSKFVLSGRSSPRTPLVKTSSNISKLIQLEKDRYKQQHESLMLVQPQTAVASILEAQLELSQGHLFDETLYDDLDDEEPFELEPGPPIGQQPEPFATYYDWDVIQQSRQKLNQLLSGAAEEKSQQQEQKEQTPLISTTYGGNSFKLYAEEPKPFTFYSNSYQNNFGFEETPKFVVPPPDDYDWKDENEELDPVIEFAKNRLAKLMGSSDPKLEKAEGVENQSLPIASNIPSTSFMTTVNLNEKVEEKEGKEEQAVVNVVEEKEDKPFISLTSESNTFASIPRSVSSKGTVENAMKKEQKEGEENLSQYHTTSSISKTYSTTTSVSSAESILSKKTLQNETEVKAGSSTEAGQTKGLLPTEYLQLLDYTPETQSVVSDTAYIDMDPFKQDYFLEETLETTYPEVNLAMKKLSPIETKSKEDKALRSEVIQVLTDKTNLEEEKDEEEKRDLGVHVIETLEIDIEEDAGVEEEVYPEVFYIEIDESENDIDPSKEAIEESSISVLKDFESIHNDTTTKLEVINISSEQEVHVDNANIVEEREINYQITEHSEEQNNKKRSEIVISTSSLDETSETSSLKYEPQTLNPEISKLISKSIRKEKTIPITGVVDKHGGENKPISCNVNKDLKHKEGLSEGQKLSDERNASIIPPSLNHPTASISETSQMEAKATTSSSTSKTKKGKKKKSKKSK